MELTLFLIGIGLFILSRFMKPFRGKQKSVKGKKAFEFIFEWVETFWSSLLMASVIMYFFIQAFKIPSGSMRTTFLEGDHLFVNKYIYGIHVPFSGGVRFWEFKKVKRGDIIIFDCPPAALTQEEVRKKIKKDFIKRCVGVSGDMIEIKDKKLFVNGKPVDETYIRFDDDSVYQSVTIFPSQEQYQRAWEQGKLANLSSSVLRDNFGPVIVPAGCYFAMGDNRDRSFDSRFWGPVPDKNLKGRALFIYWPVSRIKVVKNNITF